MPQQTAGRIPVLASAVFRLDGWLRRRQAVFEYTDREDCIFRAQTLTADRAVALGDGTRIRPGDLLLNIHLWNEHIPPASGDRDVSWARTISHRLAASLCELERAVERRPELRGTVAVVADMALGTEGRGEQIVRMSRRYGFEAVEGDDHAPGMVHRLGENMLMFLLVLAANPAAARLSVLRRGRRRVYLSRNALRRCRQRFASEVGDEG